MADRFTLVVPERFQVGESPVWNAATGELLWCDVLAGTIHALEVASGRRRLWQFGEPVGSFGLCRSGSLVVALRADVILFDPRTGARTVLAHLDHARPAMRLNDGKVGPDGAFWVGSIHPEAGDAPEGRLYRIAPDGSVRVVAERIAVSNGLSWNAAATRLYHADTRGGAWIDVWDFDASSGATGNRRRFADAGETIGRADGGACDVDGTYWSAAPFASRINRFTPDGSLLDWIEVPVFRPTATCFGGPDLRTLYITSLSVGVDAATIEQHPLCGAIVSMRTHTPGVPVGLFDDTASAAL